MTGHHQGAVADPGEQEEQQRNEQFSVQTNSEVRSHPLIGSGFMEDGAGGPSGLHNAWSN
jgi:hypothetical protein